jgi:oligopeptide/dipeptide ABC transporter ATP-binding protein
MDPDMTHNILLSVQNLSKYFPVKRGILGRGTQYVKAVDGVSFSVKENYNLAIVGESGSGKTTLGRMICRLVSPTSGRIELDGKDINQYHRLEYSRLVQPVFQDPYSALNPWKKIRDILSLPFKIHKIQIDKETLVELLEKVALPPEFLNRYTHELSGGQRQRVVIARAIALKPKLIVADEPVSGLDVTIQAQIMGLLKMLQEEEKNTYIIISHDLNLVKKLCKEVVVMYLGKICEIGPLDRIIENPIHPYTRSLLESFPKHDPNNRKWVITPPLSGEVPSPVNPPSGCRFRTRCPLAQDKCAELEPPLVEVEKNHFVACPPVLGGWDN